jgi:RNA polymerase sigma-70 factor (ECF subfamily)
MVRISEGDAAAFETLYDRYKTRIATFITRMIGDRDWAEDLTQEVFLRVCRSPRAFDPRGRFMTWIFAVARNLCIDFMRMKKMPSVPVGFAEEGSEAIEPSTPHSAEPLERALRGEADQRIQTTVFSLSKKLREVFVLCAIQGLSYEEVAAIVGCPVKTVSSRLSRARERFMTTFERYMKGSRPLVGVKRTSKP